MKNCKTISLLFGEAFSGELNEEELQNFNIHINECPTCNIQYNEFKNTLNIMANRKRPEMKDEFWDNYWDNLSEKAFLDKPAIHKKISSSLSILFTDYRKFALPAAALVLILFGLFLGKIVFSPESTQVLQKGDKKFSNNLKSINRNSTYYTMINNHIDDLKPIFTEYSNFQASDNYDSEHLSVRKELLKKLLLQNYLLKRVADKKNDPQLTSLIEDTQLILLEIINNNSTGNEKINSVKNILNGNDVIFKMNMIKKKNRFYKESKKGEII